MNKFKVFLESSVDSCKEGEFICIRSKTFSNWAKKWVELNTRHTVKFLHLAYIPEIKFSEYCSYAVYGEGFTTWAPLSAANRFQLLDLSKYDISMLPDGNGYRVCLFIDLDKIVSSSHHMTRISKARFIHTFIHELSEFDQFCRDREDFSSILNMSEYTPKAIKDLEEYNIQLNDTRATLDADKYLRYIGVRDTLIEYIHTK